MNPTIPFPAYHLPSQMSVAAVLLLLMPFSSQTPSTGLFSFWL
jgi:hypothetical protein